MATPARPIPYGNGELRRPWTRASDGGASATGGFPTARTTSAYVHVRPPAADSPGSRRSRTWRSCQRSTSHLCRACWQGAAETTSYPSTFGPGFGGCGVRNTPSMVVPFARPASATAPARPSTASISAESLRLSIGVEPTPTMATFGAQPLVIGTHPVWRECGSVIEPRRSYVTSTEGPDVGCGLVAPVRRQQEIGLFDELHRQHDVGSEKPGTARSTIRHEL